jgi:hypothetical protein
MLSVQLFDSETDELVSARCRGCLRWWDLSELQGEECYE